MGHAVALKSNNDTARLIESLWDACSVLEQKPSMRALNYPPHVSLGIYEEISEAALFEVVDSVAANFGKLETTFNELRTFEAKNTIVLWAKPTSLERLHRLHGEIHSLVDPQLCEFYYRPENWIAHCTLAAEIDVSRKAEVTTFVSEYKKSIEVVFDVIDCVSFFPIEVRHENVLHGAL